MTLLLLFPQAVVVTATQEVIVNMAPMIAR